jgi:hypothetical protein
VAEEKRRRYVEAYRPASALQTGFERHRAFAQDAEENREMRDRAVAVPVLYVRGDHESREL